MGSSTARVVACSHPSVGYIGGAHVQHLGQTSPGGYHLHYVNEPDGETVIWLDPAGAPVTGIVLGQGAGPQDDVAAIMEALQALSEIEAVLRGELKARIGA